MKKNASVSPKLFSTPVMILIVIAIFALIAVGKTGKKSSRHAANALATSSANPVSSLTGGIASSIPEGQQKVMRDSRAALVEVSRKSASAKDLLAFYDRAAIPAKKAGENIVTVSDSPSDGSPWFFVAADEQSIVIDEQSKIAANFDCRPFPRMSLRESPFSQLVRGLVLAHETEHAIDCIARQEPESEFLDDVWLQGELHAHAKVFQILNELSDAGWERLVTASQERRVKAAVSRGMHPEAKVFGQFPEDIDEVKRLFPQSVENDLGFFLAQLDIDANLKNVVVQLKAYGLPEEQTDDRSLDVARDFYKRQAKMRL